MENGNPGPTRAQPGTTGEEVDCGPVEVGRCGGGRAGRAAEGDAVGPVGHGPLEFSPRFDKVVTEVFADICWVLGLLPVLVDLANLVFLDESDDPAEVQVGNNDTALVGLVLGLVLPLFNMLITGLTDADPVAADFLGPLGVVVLSVVALAG